MQLIRFAKNFINLIQFWEQEEVGGRVGGLFLLNNVNNYIIGEQLELFGTAMKAHIHTKVGQSFGCTFSCKYSYSHSHSHILVFVVPALLFLIRKQPQRYFQLLWLF